MDGNVRLKRLKRAGQSEVPPPDTGESLVIGQEQVKIWVEQWGADSGAAQCGANFVAGTGAQKSSFDGTAETGVFASACNHGIAREVLCMMEGAGEKYVMCFSSARRSDYVRRRTENLAYVSQ